MSTYTHGHHESVLRSHRWRTAQNSCGYLLPRLRGHEHLLDVGCGPATITKDLEGRVASVLGVEVTEEAVALARGAGIECVLGDVHALNVPDVSFDVVHAHQVLQHVADPVQALREMARVCKPGGIVAVRDSDYLGFTWFPACRGLDRDGAVPGGRAGQRRRAAGRPATAVLGDRGWADGRHAELQHLVLRDS